MIQIFSMLLGALFIVRTQIFGLFWTPSVHPIASTLRWEYAIFGPLLSPFHLCVPCAQSPCRSTLQWFTDWWCGLGFSIIYGSLALQGYKYFGFDPETLWTNVSSGQVGTTAVAAAGVGGVVVPGMVTNATLHWLTFPLKAKYFAHDHTQLTFPCFSVFPQLKEVSRSVFYWFCQARHCMEARLLEGTEGTG